MLMARGAGSEMNRQVQSNTLCLAYSNWRNMPKFDFDIGPDKATYGPQGSQIVYETGGLGGVVTIANGLFAVVMVTALARNEFSAVAAIVTGGIYYGITTLFALLVLSGSLAQIVTNRQEQVTLRKYHALQYSVERPTALADNADPLQLSGTPPAERLPGPFGGTTYVAAEDATTARDAMLWAVSLYDGNGQPDPAKVNIKTDRERPGRLRVAAPANHLRVWLEGKKVLESVPYGVRLRIERYPDAQTLREILNG